MQTQMETLAPADVAELIATRRDLHMHPEIAFEEVRTAGVVAGRLASLGIPRVTGVARTGVLGLLGPGAHGQPPGRVVMLRADMDALPIAEENDVPYRSQVAGKMHACGHDCHTATLLSVAKVLKREESRFTGTVKLCFQPAEEGLSGADEMIRDGALENPRPDAAFGYHIWQDLDVGKVGVTTGPMLAAVDKFEVTLRGKGAHAAAPDQGLDPVLAAAHVTAALQSIVSRNVDPFLPLAVSVTQILAGTAFNIIPDHAWMCGTVRVFDMDVWKSLPGLFERVVTNTAAAFGCTAEIQYQRTHKATINDAAMAAIAREAAIEVVGEANVVDNVRTLGGEDFSSFLLEVPGCFIAVGSRNRERGLVWGHHHPRFDVDERGMEIGAEILVRIARRFAAP